MVLPIRCFDLFGDVGLLCMDYDTCKQHNDSYPQIDLLRPSTETSVFAGAGAGGVGGPPAPKPKSVPKPKGPNKSESAALLMTSVEMGVWTAPVVLLVVFSVGSVTMYGGKYWDACLVQIVHVINCV